MPKLSACTRSWILGAALLWPAAVTTAQLPHMIKQKYAPRSGYRELLDKPHLQAIDLGLEWLAKHQDASGRWDADGFMKHDKDDTPCDGPGNPAHDVGVTGLAVLAFLASNHTTLNGAYTDNVTRAIRWLKSQQAENGRLGNNAVHDFIYDHAIASLAVVEAYGLSRDRSLRTTAQRAVDYLESHRNPKTCWRYLPQSDDSDLSATSWALATYSAARDFGLKTPEAAFPVIARYLNQVSDPSGAHGYIGRGGGAARMPGEHAQRFPLEKGHSMTAAGLYCRFVLAEQPNTSPIMAAASQLLIGRPPKWDDQGSIDLYYWYYGSLAMFQAGGDHWRSWSRAVQAALLGNQRDEDNFAGSWDAVSAWSEAGGRIYATAMALLSLQAEFRFARYADLAPLPETSAWRAANTAWRQGQYAKFASQLQSSQRKAGLTEDQQQALAGAQSALDDAVAQATRQVEAIREQRRYFDGAEELADIKKRFGKLSAGKAANELIAAWARDPKVRREQKAMGKYASLRKNAKPTNASRKRALISKLEKFLKKYGDTEAGKQASSYLESLR